LKSLNAAKIGRFELHKPWIDQVKIKCEKCGGAMHREPFVLDTWHNSGAAPYARFTDEEFAKYVPVDFLTEGIDQTRGWANSLLLEHVILTGRAEALLQGLPLPRTNPRR
jgi:isoleucyl-tRNA synthetase